MVKNIIAKYKLNSIFSVTGIIYICQYNITSIPLFINTISNINIYVIYYLVIMIFMGVCISLVDIPFSYTLQTNMKKNLEQDL